MPATPRYLVELTADCVLADVDDRIVELRLHWLVALEVAAFYGFEALLVSGRQLHEEVSKLRRPFIAESGAHDERTVRDERRTPYFNQKAWINGALVNFLAEGTGCVAVLEIAEARKLSTATSTLPS